MQNQLDSTVESPKSEIDEILYLATKKFSFAVKQSFCDMIGLELDHTHPEVHDAEFINGITIYSHFLGTIQGMFLLNITEKDCGDILGLDPNEHEAESDMVGFLKECLNVAVGITLPLLESTFGNLSYSPSVYISGKVQFPNYASARTRHQTNLNQSLFSHLYLDLAEVKISTELDNVRRQLAETQKNANTDSLTKVFSRPYFARTYNRMINDCHDRKHTLSLIWIDVDHFKDYNDNYGHQIGDLTLETIGKAIISSIRNNDLAFRYGGDEFIIMLATAPMVAGLRVANRISETLKENPMVFEMDGMQKELTITLSMGVATLIPNEDPTEFLKRADALLYLAKEKGRNTIISSKEWNK